MSGRDTRAVATARSASRAAESGVSAMSAAKPHTPSCTTRTDSPSTWPVGGALQRMVPKGPEGLLQPLHPDLRVLAAELLCPGQGRVAELG